MGVQQRLCSEGTDYEMGSVMACLLKAGGPQVAQFCPHLIEFLHSKAPLSLDPN